MANRKPYPSDVSNEEWAFVAPYLALVREDAPQRNHDLREVFNGLRWIVRTGSAWRYYATRLTAVGSRLPADEEVDTLGHLLALHVTPANEQEREHVGKLAETVQEATGESVELAYVDQGYTGERPATEAETHGMRLEVIKHEEAKRGFVLLPRRWVVERDFAWASRFRRLAKDYERLPATLAGAALMSPSLASFSNKLPASSAWVHNTL